MFPLPICTLPCGFREGWRVGKRTQKPPRPSARPPASYMNTPPPPPPPHTFIQYDTAIVTSQMAALLSRLYCVAAHVSSFDSEEAPAPRCRSRETFFQIANLAAGFGTNAGGGGWQTHLKGREGEGGVRALQNWGVSPQPHKGKPNARYPYKPKSVWTETRHGETEGGGGWCRFLQCPGTVQAKSTFAPKAISNSQHKKPAAKQKQSEEAE